MVAVIKYILCFAA